MISTIILDEHTSVSIDLISLGALQGVFSNNTSRKYVIKVDVKEIRSEQEIVKQMWKKIKDGQNRNSNEADTPSGEGRQT